MICATTLESKFCFSFQLPKDKYIKIKTLYHIDYFTNWNKRKFAKQSNDLWIKVNYQTLGYDNSVSQRILLIGYS